MDVSTRLVAKALAGTSAVAASIGVATNWDEISGFFGGTASALSLEEINKKLADLGLPENCRLEKIPKIKECGTLNSQAIEKIKFAGKSTTATITTGSSATLKLEKTNDYEIFPDGVKIIFEVTANVNIPKDGNSGNITLKKGTNPEFKIKEGGGEIETAWDIHKLAGKIGLKGCSGETSGTCSFADNKKINYLENEGSFTVGGTMTLDHEQKINFEGGKEEKNQGFIFKVNKTLKVTQVTPKGISNIVSASEITQNYAHQIKEVPVSNGEKYWFLHA